MSFYVKGKTPPLRIVKQYGHYKLPGSTILYVPQYSSKAFWSNKVVWHSFMISSYGLAEPLGYFGPESIGTLRDLKCAERHIQLYKDIFIDDKVVYELKPVGEVNDGDTIQTG